MAPSAPNRRGIQHKKFAVRLSATALELLEHEAGIRFVRATQLRRFKVGIELLRGAECVPQPPR
jgi:hypothetical protein